MPDKKDFRFSHRLRVRWVEVDMQKIVFNAHYLMYFDTAITDYWRALALPYESAMHQLGGELYVKKASVEYHGSAKWDDQLDVALKCARIGNSSMTFEGAIFRGHELLITCELIYVFADPASQTSRPVPALLRKMLLDFEAGEASVDVRTGSWGEVGEQALALRMAVFVDEQKIPAELEQDEVDETALHAVAMNPLGQAVATGRLFPTAPGQSMIGRMAVDRVLRGAGHGALVLKTLVEHARQRGDTEVSLHAQQSAQGFYQRLGFTPRGAVFEEAGLPHVEMFINL